MCSILYTLLFSLALGSNVQHLQAQETVTDGDLMASVKWRTASPEFISDGNNVVTGKDPVTKEATLRSTNDQRSSTTMNPTVLKATETTTSTFVNIASSETASLTAPPEERTTTFDLTTYTTEGSIPTSTTIPTTSTTVDSEPTTKLLESTTLFTSSESTVLTTEETTTKTKQTISPTTTMSISTSPFDPKTSEISTHMPAKSTQSRSINMTTSTSITTTQQPLTLIPKTEDGTTDFTMISTHNDTDPLTVESEKSEKSFNLKIIIIIALVGCCVLMIVCIGLAMRHKKNSGKKNFGQMNGRSKKKKGAEDDVWAGPVNLGGVEKEDCSGPEEALVQGEDKPDGPEVMLSTFTMPDEKAAVGRPGSQEVKRWEEQERLLYIDEDTKGEEKDKETDQKMQQNGGEAYCLTTAV